MKMNTSSDLWVNEYTFMYSHMNPKKLENFLSLNSIPWVHLTEAVINCPCLSLISLSCIVSRWRILYLLKCDWIHFWIVSSSIQEICEDRFGRRLNAHKNSETGSSSRIVKLEHKLSPLRGDGGTLFSCEPMMHSYEFSLESSYIGCVVLF